MQLEQTGEYGIWYDALEIMDWYMEESENENQNTALE